MFGVYPFGQPYFAQAPNVSAAVVAAHVMRHHVDGGCVHYVAVDGGAQHDVSVDGGYGRLTSVDGSASE